MFADVEKKTPVTVRRPASFGLPGRGEEEDCY